MRFLRDDKLDELPSPDPEVQDVELRRMVDLLEPVTRHLIERTIFGCAPLNHAAAEIGLTRVKAERLIALGLAQLKVWLENGAPEANDPSSSGTIVRSEVLTTKAPNCSFPSEWGRCMQPSLPDDDLCVFHLEVTELGTTPDPAYHRAVVLGEKQPIQAFLSRSEMEALINGRYRGDGRRLDAYVTADPIGYEHEVGNGQLAVSSFTHSVPEEPLVEPQFHGIAISDSL